MPSGKQIKIIANQYGSSDTKEPNTVKITATINGVSKSVNYIVEPEIYFIVKPNHMSLVSYYTTVGNTVVAYSTAIGRNYDTTSPYGSVIEMDYIGNRELQIKCLKQGSAFFTINSYARQKLDITFKCN